MISPMEVTTKLAATVDTLSEAWIFIMAHVDRVGPDPEIRIMPIKRVTLGEEHPRRFDVTVSGMVPDPEPTESRTA